MVRSVTPSDVKTSHSEGEIHQVVSQNPSRRAGVERQGPEHTAATGACSLALAASCLHRLDFFRTASGSRQESGS